MRETPQLKHIEQVSDGWIKKYILTYVLPDGSDYIYEAASRKGLEAYRAELARLEARSNTAIAAIDEGAEDFGAAAVAAAEAGGRHQRQAHSRRRIHRAHHARRQPGARSASSAIR